MTSRWILLGPLYLGALIAPLLGADDQNPPPLATGVVAVVNGEEVPLEAIERSLARTHSTAGAGLRPAADLDRLLFRVVNDVLIAQEARALGLDEEPPIPQAVADFRREHAANQLEREEIWSKAIPSDEEVRTTYADKYRRATFRVMTAYERDEAMEMMKALESGADFVTLVTERSVDPYRARQGLVENIAAIDLQRTIGDLVFSLEPGQVGGPVQTNLGWSIVRLEQQEPADPAGFDDLEPLVRSVVRQQMARELRTALAQSLRSRFEVTIDRDLVASIQPRRLDDGRLLPTEAEPEAIVARIGTAHAVTVQEYSRALIARWKGVRNEFAARATAPIVLDRLIEAELVEAEALARGLDRSRETEMAVAAFENELLLDRYLADILPAQVSVSTKEMQAYYEQNRESYHRPPRVRLGQITVTSEKEADTVAELLRQGTDFAWLARSRSQDRLAAEGGERGWYVPRPGMSGFNLDLFDAQIGAVLGPYGEGQDWMVYKVLDRQEQGIYSYDEVSGNIRQAVYDQKVMTSIDRLIEALRQRSEIRIDEEALAALRISGTQETTGLDPGGHGHEQ